MFIVYHGHVLPHILKKNKKKIKKNNLFPPHTQTVYVLGNHLLSNCIYIWCCWYKLGKLSRVFWVLWAHGIPVTRNGSVWYVRCP